MKKVHLFLFFCEHLHLLYLSADLNESQFVLILLREILWDLCLSCWCRFLLSFWLGFLRVNLYWLFLHYLLLLWLDLLLRINLLLRLGLLLLWLFFFSRFYSFFDNLMVMIRISVHKIVRSGSKWLLFFIRVFFINRNGTFHIAMILVKHVINDILLPFWFLSLRFWLLYVQRIFDTIFVFDQLGRTMTTFNKLNSMEQESSYFKRS